MQDSTPTTRPEGSTARGIRALCAIATALSFVFAPFATLAQQAAGDKGGAAGGEAAAGPAADAAAGPTPTLFLMATYGVQDQVSTIIPERIGEMLRTQLQGAREAELLPTYQALMKKGGGSANAAVSDAYQMYTSGIGLLAAGENERAARTFQSAVDTLENNLGDLDNFNVLVDAYRNMALAYHLAGFDLDARKKIQIFAHLRPGEKLDAEKFPDELRGLYQAEVAKIQKAGAGKLTVSADAPEAQVFIDGAMRGVTPLELTDVTYGYHFLVVKSPSGKAWSERIQVKGRNTPQKFEAKLGAPTKPADGGEDGYPAFYSGLVDAIKSGKYDVAQVEPYLTELQTRTGAGYLAWVAMMRKGSDYVAVPFVWDAKQASLVRGDDVKFNLSLSNLRVGVNQLSTQILGAVGKAPGERAVSEVDMTAPAAVAAVVPQDSGTAAGEPAPATDTAPPAQKPAQTQADKAPVAAVTPPPEAVEEEKDDSDLWLWVGVGSAAVVVAGIVVGGILLFGDDEPATSSRFDTALSW